MKTLFVILIVVASVSSVFADTDVVYPNKSTEMFFIGASIGLSLVNVIGMVTAEPSYWLGGIGTAVGVATLGLTTAAHPRYETGLWTFGTLAATTGLIALVQHSVLDSRAQSTRLEPEWREGTPGLSLVIDF
jgi:peptidoglycan/LPS O-acetylase OafA/YrhL